MRAMRCRDLQLTLDRSTVFVEADFEMRPAEPTADGTPIHDRVLLRHRTSGITRSVTAHSGPELTIAGSMSVISRVRAAAEEEGEHQAE